MCWWTCYQLYISFSTITSLHVAPPYDDMHKHALRSAKCWPSHWWQATSLPPCFVSYKGITWWHGYKGRLILPSLSQASGGFNVTPWQSARFTATMNHVVVTVNSFYLAQMQLYTNPRLLWKHLEHFDSGVRFLFTVSYCQVLLLMLWVVFGWVSKANLSRITTVGYELQST